MGTLMSLSSLACCCTSSACSLGCSACSSCESSSLSKIMYGIILLVTAILSCCMLAPGLRSYLSSFPFCDNSDSVAKSATEYLINWKKFNVYCSNMVGYLAVYRICFVVTLFFLFMSIIMIGVKNSKDFRAPIQNGFWGLKILLLIIGCVGAFFIPHSSFGIVWMYIGLIGGLIFILVQLVLIVDFAHLTVERWQHNYYGGNYSFKMYYAFLTITILTYAMVLTAVVLCFIYYTGEAGDDCRLHKFFISFNGLLCIVLSIFSVLPVVQQRQPHSGLLQASFVSLFIIYLTWSAMSNHPDERCKPNFDVADLDVTTQSMNQLNSTGHDIAAASIKKDEGIRLVTILELAIWFCCILYSSVVSSSNSSAARLTMRDLESLNDDKETSSNDESSSSVNYNWSLFHLLFGLATLSVMMTLTNWYSPSTHVDIQSFSSNISAVWIKIISSWACFTIYMWTLVAPIIFPDRDFS